MSLEITESQPILLGIDLEQPFPLGFGTLSRLPRVLYHVKALGESGNVEGIGEASIDFPFTNYDAWDVYYALSQQSLKGKVIASREQILGDEKLRQDLLHKYPAAFAALNMAIDDLWGRNTNQSVIDFYGQQRACGRALSSIGFQEEVSLLVDQATERSKAGFIPKPKVGKSFEDDLATIEAIDKSGIPFVLDFNARYEVGEFIDLAKALVSRGVTLEKALFLEQPTNTNGGVTALAIAKMELEKLGITTPIIADESFVDIKNALACVKNGIGLNFKLQKIGGITYAREIEMAILESAAYRNKENMVGGTFPTAIGRTYDQQGAAVLRSTQMPSDGWEPSTDWFTGKKHLIDRQFPRNANGSFSPIVGPGLGVNPNWDNIVRFVVKNPREEYRKIRLDGSGESIAITLRGKLSYSEEYLRRSGKEPDWNL